MTFRLAIDAVGAKHSGAATVLEALVAAALRRSWAQLVVFCSPRRVRQFSLPVDSRLTEFEVAVAERGAGLGRIWWHSRGLGVAARRCGADALLCLSGGGVAPSALPGVTFIQQSLPFAPEVLRRLSLADRVRFAAVRMMMKRSCSNAKGVIVQTRTMKECVSRAFGVPPERVHVVEPGPTLPLGPEAPRVPAVMARVPADRRILYVGNISPYKNLGVLGRAMPSVRARIPDAVLFATIPAQHFLAACPGVVPLGAMSSVELVEHYRAATVLVMPSLVETVGLPMLEAAAVGVPVLAADRPYAHDVCAGTARYFEPEDPEALSASLAALLLDARSRRELARTAEDRVRRKTDADPYGRMLDIVRGLAAQRQSR